MRRGSSSEAAGFVAEASSSVRPQSLSMLMSRSASSGLGQTGCLKGFLAGEA